jgi:hypothetical protein
MKRPVRQSVMEATFDAIKDKIDARVNHFRRYLRYDNYECGPDDLLGVAHDAFMEACLTYRKSKGKLEHWAQYLISRRLRDLIRQRIRRMKLIRFIRGLSLSWWEGIPDDRLGWTELLSEDAKKMMAVGIKASHMGAKPRQARRATVEVLKQAGWSLLRIDTAMQEIQNAITER